MKRRLGREKTDVVKEKEFISTESQDNKTGEFEKERPEILQEKEFVAKEF